MGRSQQYMYMYMYMLPKQCLHWRVSGGFSLRAWLAGLAAPDGLYVPSFLLLFTILGACHLHPSAAEWSLAPLSTVKHNEFGPFCLQDASSRPGQPSLPLAASWVPSWSFWECPGSVWELLGGSLEALGAYWEPLGATLLACWLGWLVGWLAGRLAGLAGRARSAQK